MKRCLLMFAPVIALALWAAAAALGADPQMLRVVGPAVTAVAFILHITTEITLFKEIKGRGHRHG